MPPWLLALFRFNTPPPVLWAACSKCDGRSGQPPIEGDGPPICLPCIYRNARAAADPTWLTDGEARMLVEAHGDVVRLVRVSGPYGSYWKWGWTTSWPTGAAA